MTETRKIEERENGPLVVSGAPKLRGPEGELETKPVMALCRCGASKNKPFCDGTHNETGFESRGGKPAGRNRIIAYEGTDVTVNFNPMLCAHAAECARIAGHIFNSTKRPWIAPDEGTVEEVESVVKACPSGALSLAPNDGAVAHLVTKDVEIEIEPNGPYWVKNIAPPVPMDAEGGTEEKYVLCRCGQSGNKPFCDGSHRDAKWRDTD